MDSNGNNGQADAIHIDSFRFSYPTVDEFALDGISFDLSAGEVLGVVGPVEAGKTTLAMALAGFAPRHTGGTTEGTIFVAGRDPREARDNQVAMVFEDYSAQLTQVRVVDEVVAPLTNRGIPRSEATDRARELLDRVRLAEAAEQFTWELSGGQQQRLALAAALAIDPNVLIFDTATDMLDPAGRDEVGNLIASLKGETTLVITENDPDALVGIADQLLVLDGGREIASGAADDLLRDIELLESVGVAAPVCCRIAREVGLPDAPTTPREFIEAIDPHTAIDVGQFSSPQAEAPDGGLNLDPPEFGDTVIEVDEATYRYSQDTVAIEDVNLEVREGEVHAIIGGNGAGKTTLSKLLVGLFKPDEGQVLVDGELTDNRPARDIAETVGIALQNPDEQLSEQTVQAELRFPLETRQYERTGPFGLLKRAQYEGAFIEDRVETVRNLVGISDDLLEEDPMFLPRGKRRLVVMTGALVTNPDALILDEPIAGVDATARGDVERTIEHLRDEGTAIVVIDHDMDFVCEVADTVTVLENGEVAMQGPVDEVFAEENWDWLNRHHLRPPLEARLAHRLGVHALTLDQVVSNLKPRLRVAR